jgi:predicted membrane-bound spermidine synthase
VSGTGTSFALKFGFSLLTILVPTVLMGGTLPVMTRLVTRSLGELRGRVAALYGFNSAGAVAGVFLADFWWIPSVGLQATVLAGATLNLLVGVAAWLVSIRLTQEGVSVDAAAAKAGAHEVEVFSPAELRLAVVAIGVSGFVAMLYEVVWTRMLALALGSSTHAFSIMLITFITGIAAGAWVVGRWRSLRRSLDAFGWAELALAATLAGSMGFYDLVPYAFAKLAELLARRPAAYPIYEAIQASICFLVMFVPTLCLGMTLPLASRVATAELARTGRSVGGVFAANTLGTVLGAALAGLWLMPWLGLARTFALGIALNAVVGAWIVCRRHCFAHPVPALAGVIAAVALVTWAGGAFTEAWQRISTVALWRSVAPPSLELYRQALRSTRVLYYRDGAGVTVSVESWPAGGKTNLSLKVNGKPDATTSTDLSTQLLMGHLPMLLRPSSQRLLVVGLGSGMTASAVLQHPGVQQVEVVEIAPEVIEASRLFAAHNHGVHTNARVRFIVDDAKSFLQTAARPYDAILSEPSNPWLAGVAGVFSREYYESCRARLQPDGLMAQWVQVYETDDPTFEVVLNTFLSVFPFTGVWQVSASDLLLIGSGRPIGVDLDLLQRRFDEPAVKTDLERVDLGRLPTLLARELIPPENTLFLATPGGRIHSDYYPILEYYAQRAFFVRGGARLPMLFDQHESPRPTTLLGRYLRTHKLTDEDFRAMGAFFQSQHLPEPRLYRSMLRRWQAESPAATDPPELLGKSVSSGTACEFEAQRLGALREKLFANAPQDPEALGIYASLLYQAYVEARSVFYVPPTGDLEAALTRLVEANPANRRVYQLLLAEIAWDRGDDPTCFRLADTALSRDEGPTNAVRFDLDPKAPARVLTRMIESLYRSSRLGGALELCENARRYGYVGRPEGGNDPLLEMTVRKVEAMAAARMPQAAGPPPTNATRPF